MKPLPCPITGRYTVGHLVMFNKECLFFLFHVRNQQHDFEAKYSNHDFTVYGKTVTWCYFGIKCNNVSKIVLLYTSVNQV